MLLVHHQDRVVHALVTALEAYGHRVDLATSLDEARDSLCSAHYQLLLSDASVPDADMVDFAVALKAGHARSSGVPASAQRMLVVLLSEDPRDESVGLSALGAPFMIPNAMLIGVVLDLLDGVSPDEAGLPSNT